MTPYLLDVNVLLALSDPMHIHHDVAHQWFESVGQAAWATCPLTENGYVRIASHPHYPNRPGDAHVVLSLLRDLCSSSGHVFWPDDIRLDHVLRPTMMTTHALVTEIYLLGLAVHHNGHLATFDHKLTQAAIGDLVHGLAVISRSSSFGWSSIHPMTYSEEGEQQIGDARVFLRHHTLPELIVTTGRLMAWDPLWIEETTPALAITVPIGRYPVVVTCNQSTIAYSTVRISDRPPTRWSIIGFENDQNQLAEDELPAYPVDTGLGCFMDAEAAYALTNLISSDDQFAFRLSDRMTKTEIVPGGWQWGEIHEELGSAPNVICFTAGFGDGGYASYAGYDDSGELVCVTTDFSVLGQYLGLS